MLTPFADVDALAATRSAFHSLAEHVLAPDLMRSIGRIGLRRTAGGFGQPEHMADGHRRRVRIDGVSLVVDHDADGETWHDITSLGAAAALVELPAGATTGVFEPSSPDDPDVALVVDPIAAAVLAEWFRFVDAALEEFRHRHAALRPTAVQLWPEHFDLATTMSEINFGGSPGDAGRPEPYLYVGPWSPPPVGGFWNEPYGAAVARSDVSSVDDALAFFEQGLAEAAGQRGAG
jgi:hypothetical protein